MVHFNRVMLPIISNLNAQFGADGITTLVPRQTDFRPHTFDEAMASLVADPGSDLYAVFMGFLQALPPPMRATIMAVVSSALQSKPPTMITFAWAPGYDYELTQWYVPEPPPAMSGITLLLKTRYPEDPHPTTGTQAVRG